MNFYFNYFLLIGREHINCLLSTVHIEGIWARARVAAAHYARIPKSFTYVSHSFAFPFGQRPKGWGDKPNGAKARSSEELKFLSSQATLSYRVAVATDERSEGRDKLA